MAPPAGHGPVADLLEGRGSAGLPGYLPGDVDPPAWVAALRCSHAPRESRLRLVNPGWVMMVTIFLSLYLGSYDCNCLLFYIRNRTPGQNKNVFWKNIVKLLTFLNSVNSIFFIWSHDRIFAKKHFDIVHLYLNQRDIKQIRTSSSMHISRFEINIRVSKYWEERREVSRESRAEVGCHISQPGPYNVGIPRMASKICQRQRQPRTMGADMLTCHAPIAYTRCVGVYLQGEIKHVSASHLLIL